MSTKEKVDWVFKYYESIRLRNIIMITSALVILYSIFGIFQMEVASELEQDPSPIFLIALTGITVWAILSNFMKFEVLKYHDYYNNFGIHYRGGFLAEYSYSFDLFLYQKTFDETQNMTKEKLKPNDIKYSLEREYDRLHPAQKVKKGKEDISEYYKKL